MDNRGYAKGKSWDTTKDKSNRFVNYEQKQKYDFDTMEKLERKLADKLYEDTADRGEKK
jgi:hypothetical protein